MRFILSVVFFFYNLLPVLSQLPENHQVIEELIEKLIEELIVNDIPGIDPTVIYEDLLFLGQNPLNINTADAEQLRNLYLINELQIANLIGYREQHGELLTIYELQYIDGFSQEDVRKMVHFVVVEELPSVLSVSPAAVIRHGRHQLFLRLQQVFPQQRGFASISDSALASRPNSRYLGSTLKIYNRYQFNYGNKVQAGFVAEKDSGEEFFRGSNPHGFDYYSMHIQINDVGRFRTIALGDFQSGFGQGLVLWSGMAFGKSANTLNIRKNSRGINKYSSTDENMFFRGAGVTYGFSESTEGSLFFSRKKVDAGISVTDDDGKVLEVTSLQNTGLHATPSQLAGKNVLGETIFGGNITYNHRFFKVGSTFAALEYDALLNSPERVYNQFDFRGKKNISGGLDYQFSVGSVRFFGEGAISSSGGTAFLGGGMANLSSKISLSTLYRKYARDYHSYFSNGFRENTRTANEEGLYIGTLIHPFNRWKLSAYFDFFSFPWMRYGAYAPSAGIEYFLQLDFNYSRNLHMYASFRHKEKPVNSADSESPVRKLSDAGTSRLRYHINYFVSPELEFRNRVELSKYEKEEISPERGFLLYQDILYKPVKLPLSFAFRFAVFETDTYNVRLYAYENDVLYAFSIPAYYDSGYRTYLLVQYSTGEMLDLWMRFALTKLPGRDNIGSGLNEINGDARSEIKLQVRLRF